MNEVTLSGWVYKKPRTMIFRTDKGESKYTTYMLLVENGFDYHKKELIFIYSFGKRAEWVDKYIKPNTKIILKGFLNNKKSVDEDGKTAYRLCVVAYHHEFASSLPVDESTLDEQKTCEVNNEIEKALQEQEVGEGDMSEREMIEQFLLSSVNDFYE